MQHTARKSSNPPLERKVPMCGVVGALFPQRPDLVASTLAEALNALKHRGQCSAGFGVQTLDNGIVAHRELGPVGNLLAKTKTDLDAPGLRGHVGIAHARYSTSGVDFDDPRSTAQATRVAQPFRSHFRGKEFYFSYNGNLVESCVNRLSYELHGVRSPETSFVDTELIGQAMERSQAATFEDALFKNVLPQLRGAFSLVFLYGETLYAVRDPWGFRPLVVGEIEHGYLVLSEDGYLRSRNGGGRQLKPGEYVKIVLSGDSAHAQISRWAPEQKACFCGFELVYFFNIDACHCGISVTEFRRELGRRLALACPPPAGTDMVVGVPDSGRPAAYGYAMATGIPYDDSALFRRKLAGGDERGRSFIEPTQERRLEVVDGKLGTLPDLVHGKVVVVVDDSTVRGDVACRVAYLLKHAGAKEVHLLNSCPPIKAGCPYGLDTMRMEHELIARGRTVKEVLKEVNRRIPKRYGRDYRLDSLGYLPLQEMVGAWKGEEELCTACWTGKYPVL